MEIIQISHDRQVRIYWSMTYLQEIVNQKVNILMKTKIEMNLNRKSEIKSHFGFLSITWVFEMFHFELRNIMKFLFCYDPLRVGIKKSSEDLQL